MPKFVYGAEHEKWVTENKDKYTSYDALAHDFNVQFSTEKSVNAVQQYMMKYLGLYLQTARKATHYTQAEEEWLRKNYANYAAYAELTEALNSTFEKVHSVGSVQDKCTKQLGLSGMFNPTAYRAGNVKEQCPIGTIRKTGNGCTYIKMLDSAYSYQSGYREPYWLPLQKKIWIDQYGEVPDGKMVMFLDGNQENLDINNLYCIDRKISAAMAANGWYSGNAELTLTAIKWCELHFALKA